VPCWYVHVGDIESSLFLNIETKREFCMQTRVCIYIYTYICVHLFGFMFLYVFI
jgi:hypothetical protein